MNCNISKICQRGNYLAVIVAVAMSQRSYPQRQPLYHVCPPLCIWPCNVPKCQVSHASSFVRPPVLTSFPLQPSAAASHNTPDRSAAFALPDTNLVAHILTQKTCTINYNKICPKAAQEDTINGSVSSTPEPYCAHRVSHPKFHRAHINSTLF
jgi:hypothetical protein